VKQKSGVLIRANYSANADIILDRRDAVLAINESAVVYDSGKAFVEVETGPQRFERRALSLGLSDGIWVEVKSGIDQNSRVKKQDPGTDTVKSGAPGAAKPARR
jgi:HlyD family secretion protein